MNQAYLILRDVSGASVGPRPTPMGMGAADVRRPPQIRLDVESLDPQTVKAAAREPAIVSVAPVMPVRLIAPRSISKLSPDDRHFNSDCWGIEAIDALDCPFDGTSIAVGILDTGVEVTHPAFVGVQFEQRDFTGEGIGDGHGHGTHCAGTILGRTVDGVRIGVAPGVPRAHIGKVLDASGSGSSAAVVQGILWCAQSGALVISLSLGLDFPGMVSGLVAKGYPIELATSLALRSYHQTVILFERLASLLEAQHSIGTGCLLVAAAGNESQCERDPSHRIWASPPASAPGVIAVAALDRPGVAGGTYPLAPFSNSGADIAAPGVGILSARLGGGLCSMDGTSMAAPHVVGVAALWAQKLLMREGAVRIDSLRTRVLGTARSDLLDPTVRQELGGGMITAPGR